MEEKNKYVYQKNYYDRHNIKLREIARNKYANNKDEINKKVVCPVCKRTIIWRMKSKHDKTRIHLKALNIEEPLEKPLPPKKAIKREHDKYQEPISIQPICKIITFD